VTQSFAVFRRWRAMENYGYLLAALVGLPAVLAVLLVFRRRRKDIVLAGVLESVHAPPLVLFQGVYWSPQRVGGLALGAEDFILCFSLGCGAWAAAALPQGARLRTNFVPRTFVRRALIVAVPTTALGFAIWLAGAGVITCLITIMIVTAAMLLSLRPSLWRLSAWSMAIYPPYYCAVLYAAAWLGTDFFAIWDGPQLSGVRLWGLPVEEIAFVYSFALCYPVLFGWIVDVSLLERPSLRAASERGIASALNPANLSEPTNTNE
jgi:hypothetical protein